MTSREETTVSNVEFRVIGIVLLVVFTVTLAVMVGNRLSAEALAVLVGIVCGVAASIPTGLLIMAITRRPDSAPERRQYQETQRLSRPSPREYPPVIIVNPGGSGPTMSQWLPPIPQALTPGEGRRFRVIGQEEEDVVTLDAEGYE